MRAGVYCDVCGDEIRWMENTHSEDDCIKSLQRQRFERDREIAELKRQLENERNKTIEVKNAKTN